MQLSLNSRQKHALAKIFACADYLQQALDQADKHIPKDVKTALKHATTWTRKTWDSWLTQCDDKTARGVVNLVRDFELVIMNKRAARDGIKELEAMVSGKEYVERMAEVVMDARCRTCDGKCRDACPIYESFRHFEVPEFDPGHAYCPYSQMEVVS